MPHPMKELAEVEHRVATLYASLEWVPALEEAINRSRAVAILFGKHGIGNTQQYERQFALVRQTHEAAFPVIPVLMPGCEIHGPWLPLASKLLVEPRFRPEFASGLR
jgi:hypothetical protein